MEKQVQSLLLPFHFGSIDDTSRLVVEREMLQDPEILVEYFDLKRDLESAAKVPKQPSIKVWNRLKHKAVSKKAVTWSFGLALAASLAFLCFYFLKTQVEVKSIESGILFDSGSELSGSSHVL